MIDLARLRKEPEQVLALIKKKDPTFDGPRLLILDEETRRLKTEVDELRNRRNELAQLGKMGVTEELRAESKRISDDLKFREEQLAILEADFKNLYLHCPNLILDSVPVGTKDDNVVVRQWGEKPTFNFTPLHHMELGTALGWFDFEAATRMSGPHFSLFKGPAVPLVYKLMLFMLNTNMAKGYTPIIPPYLVNQKALEGAGNFPRFAEEVYTIPADQLYLTPTSEVNLTAVYRDETLQAEELPIRLTAWTSCFRREAGGYGAAERGLIRVHQFEKVEIYTLCQPENAPDEQDRMLACAESILQALGLHYRVSLLASQDCSFSSAKTFDIEVWMPGQDVYKEVSSISNCTDFQARRSSIKFKKGTEKGGYVYTLNGSSLALPRVLVALMETYQQADGSIAVPSALSTVTVK